MRRVALALTAVIATVSQPACGDGDSPAGPDRPPIEGTWQGQISGEPQSSFGPLVRLYLLGPGDGAPVTGSAELARAGEVTVSGRYHYPIVVLTLSGGAAEPLQFAGRFTATGTIAGSLTWPGHYDVADLTLTRQAEVLR